MKLFFWKSNFVIDSFAKKLADDFFSGTRPEVADAYFREHQNTDAPSPETNAKTAGKAAAKQTRAKQNVRPQQFERSIHDTALKLAQFKAQEKLGVYGKARLHMSFADRLTELGFSKDTVQQLNRMLLLKSP